MGICCWLCIRLKRENEDGVKMYEECSKQTKIFIYDAVKVGDDDVIKYDFNILQEVWKTIFVNNFI